MRRLLSVVVVGVCSLLLVVGPAAAGVRPHLTDPAGDADTPWCSLVVGAQCLPTAPRHSEPSIDIVAVSFAAHGSTLLASLDILDIDHPPVGEHGPSPSKLIVMFDVGDVRVTLNLDRDSAGATEEAYLFAFVPENEQTGVIVDIPATVDTARNRVRYEVPFSVIDEAVAQMCDTCAPITRGSVLAAPSAASYLWGQDLLTTGATATDMTAPGPDYTVGR